MGLISILSVVVQYKGLFEFVLGNLLVEVQGIVRDCEWLSVEKRRVIRAVSERKRNGASEAGKYRHYCRHFKLWSERNKKE